MKHKDISYVGTAITDLDILRRLPASHQQLLSEENGFLLFGGGLHVRGRGSYSRMAFSSENVGG